MSKLSSYRRIYDQDYQGANQDLVSKLATPINASFGELYDLANNNITFSDNINCTISTFTISVDANGKPLNATQIKLSTYQTSVRGMWVISAFGANDSTVTPSGAVGLSFTKNNTNIIINNVKGLTPNVSYSITAIAIS